MVTLTKTTEKFLLHTKARHPVICGAMYPCSNPELIAAAARSGAAAIIQPLSLVFVHGHTFEDGLKICLRGGPSVGLNLIVENSSRIYRQRMEQWLELSINAGLRFFVTALGNPKWVVDRVKDSGGIVYHDVTERKWAEKALEAGVHGLICVNRRAGGHAGQKNPQELYDDLKVFDVPLVCAGGIADRESYRTALATGYAAVQMGTRFIASSECLAPAEYKNAIVQAKASDIILTNKITGVDVAVISTPHLKKSGARVGWFGQQLLKNKQTKHFARAVLSILSAFRLKNSIKRGFKYTDFWQAGQSVEGIHSIKSTDEIIKEMVS